MDFEVYCDESWPDLLSSVRSNVSYMVIGSLWFPAELRVAYKDAIHQLRDKHRVGGELKWQKISRSREDFYRDLVVWFCEQGEDLRFRAIAVDQQRVDLQLYHEDDQTLKQIRRGPKWA